MEINYESEASLSTVNSENVLARVKRNEKASVSQSSKRTYIGYLIKFFIWCLTSNKGKEFELVNPAFKRLLGDFEHLNEPDLKKRLKEIISANPEVPPI